MADNRSWSDTLFRDSVCKFLRWRRLSSHAVMKKLKGSVVPVLTFGCACHDVFRCT